MSKLNINLLSDKNYSIRSGLLDLKVQLTINDYIKDTIKMKSIMESLDKKLTY